MRCWIRSESSPSDQPCVWSRGKIGGLRLLERVFPRDCLIVDSGYDPYESSSGMVYERKAHENL